MAKPAERDPDPYSAQTRRTYDAPLSPGDASHYEAAVVSLCLFWLQLFGVASQNRASAYVCFNHTSLKMSGATLKCGMIEGLHFCNSTFSGTDLHNGTFSDVMNF